jgi:hypothetical protein
MLDLPLKSDSGLMRETETYHAASLVITEGGFRPKEP